MAMILPRETGRQHGEITSSPEQVPELHVSQVSEQDLSGPPPYGPKARRSRALRRSLVTFVSEARVEAVVSRGRASSPSTEPAE